MKDDPIVAEVHRVRAELFAKYNNDLDAMFADIRRREVAHGTRLRYPKGINERQPETFSAPKPTVSGK